MYDYIYMDRQNDGGIHRVCVYIYGSHYSISLKIET